MNKYDKLYCSFIDKKITVEKVVKKLKSIEEMIDFIKYIEDVIEKDNGDGGELVNKLKKLVK